MFLVKYHGCWKHHNDEYDKRNNGPENFNADTFMKIGRNGASGFTKFIENRNHRSKGKNTHSDANIKNNHV